MDEEESSINERIREEKVQRIRSYLRGEREIEKSMGPVIKESLCRYCLNQH